jgi:hypothetical protein
LVDLSMKLGVLVDLSMKLGVLVETLKNGWGNGGKIIHNAIYNIFYIKSIKIMTWQYYNS